MADVSTGKVDHFPVSGEPFSNIDLKYVPNSTAILVRWVWSSNDGSQMKCVQQTFNWDGNTFAELNQETLPLNDNACPEFGATNRNSANPAEAQQSSSGGVDGQVGQSGQTANGPPMNEPAGQTDQVMGARFGNTEILENATVEWHMYFKRNGHFSGYEARSHYPVRGTWEVQGGDLCLTFRPSLRGSRNPLCRSVSWHQVGDTWMTNGSAVRLVQGIQ